MLGFSNHSISCLCGPVDGMIGSSTCYTASAKGAGESQGQWCDRGVQGQGDFVAHFSCWWKEHCVLFCWKPSFLYQFWLDLAFPLKTWLMHFWNLKLYIKYTGTSDHIAFIYTILFYRHNDRVNLEFYMKGSNHLSFMLQFSQWCNLNEKNNP